jgi:hypothetical protein
LFALKIAKKYDIPFRIRGGGHDSLNYSLSDYIIIDVSKRNYIKVKDTNIVKVGAGVKLGFLIEELNKHNMTIPIGSCPNTGVAGLVQGGGIGFGRRLWGLSLDNLLSVTMILANNEIVKVDKDNHSDLFWSIRGSGGGSFGIVTDLTFQAHKLSRLVYFELWINFCHFKKAFDLWQKWAPCATNNLTSYMQLYSANDKRKKEAVFVSGQFFGKKKELKKMTETVFGDLPTEKIFKYKTLLETECKCCAGDPDYFYKYLNLFGFDPMTKKAISKLERILKGAPASISVEVDSTGGKISTIKEDETAFPWRKSIFWMLIRGGSKFQNEIPTLDKWVRLIYNTLLQNGAADPKTHLPRSYVNFKDPELSKRDYPLVYWGNNHKKLRKVKEKYDPGNVFHFEQSVPL